MLSLYVPEVKCPLLSTRSGLLRQLQRKRAVAGEEDSAVFVGEKCKNVSAHNVKRTGVGDDAWLQMQVSVRVRACMQVAWLMPDKWVSFLWKKKCVWAQCAPRWIQIQVHRMREPGLIWLQVCVFLCEHELEERERKETIPGAVWHQNALPPMT